MPKRPFGDKWNMIITTLKVEAGPLPPSPPPLPGVRRWVVPQHQPSCTPARGEKRRPLTPAARNITRD